jgi:hypothetical protein
MTQQKDYKKKLFKFDRFGSQVPQFNFDGDSTVGSALGLGCTACVTVVVLLFTLLRFIRVK